MRFEYDRFLLSSTATDDDIVWENSDVVPIEKILFLINDMNKRVYKHHVCQAIELMFQDILCFAGSTIHWENILSDASEYLKYDDRILYLAEQGECGEEAKNLTERIHQRNSYTMIEQQNLPPKEHNFKEIFDGKYENQIRISIWNGSGESSTSPHSFLAKLKNFIWPFPTGCCSSIFS